MFGRKGDQSPHSKLNTVQKDQIFLLIQEGKTDKEIASLFGVSRMTIMRVRFRDIAR
jgi:DNA-binding NarL/FixJ family response regulator